MQHPPDFKAKSLSIMLKILSNAVMYRLCITAGLLLGATDSLSQDKQTPVTAGPSFADGFGIVRMTDGYLTVDARNVGVNKLLDEIAKHTGINVRGNAATNERITLNFRRLPLDRALRRVLRHRSFVLAYTAGRPTTLWILPQHKVYAGKLNIARKTTSGAFAAKAVPGFSTLEAALKSKDADERADAIAGLGTIGHADAVALSISALADKNRFVRSAAIDALAEIGGPEAVKALEAALRDSDPRLREQAVDSLGEIGGSVAINLIEQALEDEEEFVRQAASEALTELRGAGSRR